MQAHCLLRLPAALPLRPYLFLVSALLACSGEETTAGAVEAPAVSREEVSALAVAVAPPVPLCTQCDDRRAITDLCVTHLVAVCSSCRVRLHSRCSIGWTRADAVSTAEATPAAIGYDSVFFLFS